MAPEPTPGGAQVFAVVCNLPPGYHQYKFIVDGEWRHDENQAFIQDPLGNVNNWLFVKKPGSLNEAGHGATQQQGIPIPQHSPRRARRRRARRASAATRADPVAARKTARAPGWTGWTLWGKCRSSATWTGF